MSVPKTLELRVHGINNTSPQSMLDLPEDAVEEITGDRLGGFWRRKAAAATMRPAATWTRSARTGASSSRSSPSPPPTAFGSCLSRSGSVPAIYTGLTSDGSQTGKPPIRSTGSAAWSSGAACSRISIPRITRIS